MPLVQRYAEAALPTRHGEFLIRIYREAGTEKESILIYRGDLTDTDASPLFVRVHSECYTGEALGSLTCDCQPQLEAALKTIQRKGRGAIVYLRQEGRGIGLGNKIRAYALQAEGHDTIEANHKLGFESDLRDFTIAAEILKDAGARRIRLNTNNPAKLRSLRQNGIIVEAALPSHTGLNPYNYRYLQTKMQRMAHTLELMFAGSANRPRPTVLSQGFKKKAPGTLAAADAAP